MILLGVKIGRKDQDIIQGHLHEVVYEVSQNIVYHGLKNSGSISESKRHDSVFIETTGRK